MQVITKVINLFVLELKFNVAVVKKFKTKGGHVLQRSLILQRLLKAINLANEILSLELKTQIKIHSLITCEKGKVMRLKIY